MINKFGDVITDKQLTAMAKAECYLIHLACEHGKPLDFADRKPLLEIATDFISATTDELARLFTKKPAARDNMGITPSTFRL